MQVLPVIVCLLIAPGDPPVESPPTAEQVRFFESSIRPLLVEHCQKCHGPSKQFNGLRVDSREALVRGGDLGAAIVPGQPEASLLIRAVRHTDDDLKMPPESKLTEQQVGALVKWVKMGAPFPAGAAAIAEGRPNRDPNHWAFQPAGLPELPEISDKQWPQTAIDHFILAKLEAEKIGPAAAADRRTLIRRVTFDLHGLPPTPADIDTFLLDGSPDASRHPPMASGGAGTGSMWLAMPTRTGSTKTWLMEMPGGIAIMSCRRSIAISHSICF
jgi:hypothetical protein